MIEDDPYEGMEKLWTGGGGIGGGSDVVMYELKNGNLILKQDESLVVMSWDELQELSEFYEEAMKKLFLKLELEEGK